MSRVTADEILIKHPDERRLYTMDFTNLLATTDIIAGIHTIYGTPVGLSIPTASTGLSDSSKVVEFIVESGDDGVDYDVTVQVVSDDANSEVLVGVGVLQVKIT